jgi:broad specificity phosphatase PhoE
VAIEIVFETHAITEDNERGFATGWLPGRLSAAGRDAARALGARRRDDGIDALFVSDLWRAVETAQIAFAEQAMPLFLDWRLRECDYGDLNGAPAAEVHDRRAERLHVPYPNGESWEQATRRVSGLLHDLPSRWEGARVLVIGHIATRWAFEHYLAGVSLEALEAEVFDWQPGWEYSLTA